MARSEAPVDLIYTYCYHYDPHMAKNSMLVVRIVQLGCMLTVLALGAFILISLRQEAMQGGCHASGSYEKGERVKHTCRTSVLYFGSF